MNRTSVTLLVVILIGAVALPAGSVLPSGPVGVATAADCTFPYTSTDATGTQVTVASEPDRIVTLNPSAAQTMWEIGAEGKVVGLSTYAGYLEGAENRTDIWAGTGVDVERVVNTTPDLVLAPNTIPNDTVSQLRGAGLTVYKFESSTSASFVANKTVLTGRLVGECDGARGRADQMREELGTIGEAVDGVDRPRVLYTFFGWTAGEGTFIDTIITTAGGRNVAAEAGISGYAKLSEEVVVARDPQWIVVNTDDPNVPDTRAYQGTTAVEEGQVVTVDANYVSEPAPRIVQPMLTVVEALHPDAYTQASQGVEEIRSVPEKPPPSFSINSTSVREDEVELYGSATVLVNVTNDGGPGTFELGVYLDDSLKRYEYVDVGAERSVSVRLAQPMNSWGQHVVRVNGERAGTVSVVKNLSAGTNASEATANATNTTTNATSATETPNGTGTPTTATPAPTTASEESTAPPTTSGPPSGQGESREAQGSGTSTGATSPTEDGTPGPVSTRSAGQPGFGFGIGAVAIATAGLLARRRR